MKELRDLNVITITVNGNPFIFIRKGYHTNSGCFKTICTLYNKYGCLLADGISTRSGEPYRFKTCMLNAAKNAINNVNLEKEDATELINVLETSRTDNFY